jgi:glucokinase
VATVLAVDIGASKLAAALVDEAGALSGRQVAVTDPVDPSAALVGLVGAMLAAAPEPPVAVGVGTIGPMTLGGETISPLNVPAWRAYPLRAALTEATGLPVHIDNDAKALALGEGWLGAAVGERDYVAMVVSTGVGGGIVLDGRLLDGAAGNAGHIGHVIVVPGGRLCGCGGHGCLEAEASGTAIAAITGRPAPEAGPDVVERTGRLVGLAVASVAALLDLRLALVAGSVALGFGAPFFAAAQASLAENCVIEHARGARILPAGLGPDGPLVGAAAVAWRALGTLGRPSAV